MGPERPAALAPAPICAAQRASALARLAGATTIIRPDGSNTGSYALNTTTTTIDVARSSRAPLATDPTGGDVVAFAKDGVAWAAKSTGWQIG